LFVVQSDVISIVRTGSKMTKMMKKEMKKENEKEMISPLELMQKAFPSFF